MSKKLDYYIVITKKIDEAQEWLVIFPQGLDRHTR